MAEGALPTAPRHLGTVLEEFHCLLPPGSEAVHCTSCTANCPQAVRQCFAGVAQPTAPRQRRSVCVRYTTHCPQTVWQ